MVRNSIDSFRFKKLFKIFGVFLHVPVLITQWLTANNIKHFFRIVANSNFNDACYFPDVFGLP